MHMAQIQTRSNLSKDERSRVRARYGAIRDASLARGEEISPQLCWEMAENEILGPRARPG